MTSPTILWLRNDLRLADHAALSAAIVTGGPVVPVFVLDEEADKPWPRGAASLWWLHHSLAELADSYAEIGGRMIFRRGDTIGNLASIAKHVGANAIYFTRSYEPAGIALEIKLKSHFDGSGIALKRFGGTLLREPEEMRTKEGQPFKVYTPFWRALSSDWTPARALPAPTHILTPKPKIASDDLTSWKLLPTRPDWAGGMRETWTPGEKGAAQRLRHFLDKTVGDYAETRNRPDLEGTSRLSPHLHFGEISPRQCWHAAVRAAGDNARSDKGTETFLKEMVWREFSAHLLFHWPDLPEVPFRKEFSKFPWGKDAKRLKAWQRGLTGFPIVDAGMRELWQTGWMHNRVRMIVASFLIKDLLIPWQEGEAWFWDTLVDADLANNAASWQWVAGSGADAAPYFRIFNPVKQGQTFDPDGHYVRRYVPEIAKLSNDDIHAPWLADEAALAKAGVTIGKTYPQPMVDHAAARDRAMDAFKRIKADA